MSIRLKVDVDYPRDVAWMTEIIEREYRDALERAAKGQLAALGRQYRIDDALASGKTFKSFEIGEIDDQGDRMSIEIAPTGDRAKVAYVLEHGAEYEHIPSAEAIDNILSWMKSRRISRGLDEKQTRRLAFSIAESIKYYGLEPRDLMQKAEDHYRQYVVRIFEAASRRIARKINDRLNE